MNVPLKLPSSFKIDPSTLIRVIFFALVITVALSEIYHVVQILGEGYALSPWLSIACINTIFAGLAYFHFRKRRAKRQFTKRTIEPFLPAIVILLGTSLAVLASRFIGEVPPSVPPSFRQLAWVLWIPVIEELVFRVAIGNYFRNMAGNFWGGYFSAVVFSWVHAQPTVSRLMQGFVGIPLGPLLLGFCCEFLIVRYGRLAPAVAFHAACNLTVVIFNYGDARWLKWLGFLYV